MQTTNITIIRFANSLKKEELEFFRGAIIELASMHDASLFHNHTDDGFRYGCPLIQYKILQGRVALLGIGRGANELLWLRPYLNRELHIGYKEIRFEVMSVENIEACLGVMPYTMRYRLKDWMPLNAQNDKLFHSTHDEGERFILLEDILTASIVSFYRDMGYDPSERVRCRIERRSPIVKELYKEVAMRITDIEFRTNALLPLNIGIGKGSSLGHGIVETY
jgi:hypothetical protein